MSGTLFVGMPPISPVVARVIAFARDVEAQGHPLARTLALECAARVADQHAEELLGRDDVNAFTINWLAFGLDPTLDYPEAYQDVIDRALISTSDSPAAPFLKALRRDDLLPIRAAAVVLLALLVGARRIAHRFGDQHAAAVAAELSTAVHADAAVAVASHVGEVA